MNKIFVIAGTYQQGMHWVKQNIIEVATKYGESRSMLDYIIVKDSMTLKGYSNPHGVFVGTWRERRDIKEILLQIHVQSTGSNQKILELINEVNG